MSQPLSHLESALFSSCFTLPSLFTHLHLFSSRYDPLFHGWAPLLGMTVVEKRQTMELEDASFVFESEKQMRPEYCYIQIRKQHMPWLEGTLPPPSIVPTPSQLWETEREAGEEMKGESFSSAPEPMGAITRERKCLGGGIDLVEGGEETQT
jgi:hypothetical protein